MDIYNILLLVARIISADNCESLVLAALERGTVGGNAMIHPVNALYSRNAEVGFLPELSMFLLFI